MDLSFYDLSFDFNFDNFDEIKLWENSCFLALGEKNERDHSSKLFLGFDHSEGITKLTSEAHPETLISD